MIFDALFSVSPTTFDDNKTDLLLCTTAMAMENACINLSRDDSNSTEKIPSSNGDKTNMGRSPASCEEPTMSDE